MSSHRKLAYALGILLILIPCLVAALPHPEPVEVVAVRKGALEGTATAHGRTRYRERTLVSAPAAGRLRPCTLRAGDEVTAGTELYVLEAAPAPLLDARSRAQGEARLRSAQASVAQSRADLERLRHAARFAQRELEQARSLAGRAAVAEQDVVVAEQTFTARQRELSVAEEGAKLATSELEFARVSLLAPGAPSRQEDQLRIEAPRAGVVLRVHHELTGVVAPGTPLLELGHRESLEVSVELPTREATEVRVGARARITEWGGAEVLSGRVVRVEPGAVTRVSALGVEEERVNVVVAPSPGEPGWQLLGDGFGLSARIVLWSTPAALVVPDTAVFRTGSEWAVFAVREGRARVVPVRVGRRAEGLVEVLGGVHEHDRVVRFPSDELGDGERVHPVEKASPKSVSGAR
jgi:HlyD family secretion protein